MENWAGLSGEGATYLLPVFGTGSISLGAFTREDDAAHQAVPAAGGLIMESLANLPDELT